MKIDINFSLLIVLIIITSIIYYKKKKEIFNIDYFIFISFVCYIFYVIKFAFFPMPIGEKYISELREINNSYGIFAYSNNFKLNIDFSNLTNFYNFIFLMPLSVYLYYYKCSRAIFKIFVITLSIELIQAFISFLINYPYKVFDINDIILNSSGAIFIYLLILLIKKIYSKFLVPKLYNLSLAKNKNKSLY